MDKKITPKEIIETPKDENFEHYRFAKTLIVILIIFLLSILFRTRYYEMLENSRFLKFYPATTVFYQDFSDIGEFDKFKIDPKYKSLSYGIFKDNRDKERFLLVAKTPDADTPIIDTTGYSLFTKDGYTFLSDSTEELEALQIRIKNKNYEFLQDPNLKRLAKNLDKKREYTLVITDINYIGIPIDKEIKEIAGKIFDKTIIQIYKTENGLKINGKIAFKNKIAGFAAKAKRLAQSFSFRKIKIEEFSVEKPTLILAVKDFDLWTKTFFRITKSLPDNQYSQTFSLIQNVFNSDVETDIIQKLNGNAVIYLYKDNKKELHPMLLLETKRNLANQVRKYFGYLQLQNNSTLTEQEVNNKTYNVLNSAIYPYSLSFANFDDKLFALGHQNIIEKYTENEKRKISTQEDDFYLYINMEELPHSKDYKGFWTGYKTIELKLSLAPDVKFEGNLIKDN